MALLTIFCCGFLDDVIWLCWQFFAAAFKMTFLTIFYGFLDDFLQLYLFCFICSTKFVDAVQKSVAIFEGGVWNRGWGVCVCKSYSMDSLLLSKTPLSRVWTHRAMVHWNSWLPLYPLNYDNLLKKWRISFTLIVVWRPATQSYYSGLTIVKPILFWFDDRQTKLFWFDNQPTNIILI